MKHMIFTIPAAEKQLSNFICEPEVRFELMEILGSEITGIDVLRIAGETGNGSTHLLQAIANELRSKRKKVIYLSFKEGDHFSDLNPMHLREIGYADFLCIDGLPSLLNASSDDDILTFLKEITSKGIKLIYNDSTEEVRDRSFSLDRRTITLEPLSENMRKKWALNILGEKYVDLLPREVFESTCSNRDFLHALSPLLQEKAWYEGTDHALNQALNRWSSETMLSIRQIQLRIAELDIKKTELIRQQHYEQAAQLRDDLVQLGKQLENLHREVQQRIDTTPFTPGMVDQHKQLERLLAALDTAPAAQEATMNRIVNRINDLNNEIQATMHPLNTDTAKDLTTEIRNWKYALIKLQNR
jgi:hypothetical protein